ncbi:CoA transferase subunit A [Thermobifida halotolerans]|uniref:CoA transferase subunit A n=1 Tax=Thermobifida halotolerans TaxID=483545 RepID=A0AA97LZW4_9ACTN|nr:CoA-transferase [Thermobifida halotolerans]UOE21230.1 CoA transferase subunit A [Thermobifida halotolerans]
MSSSRTNGKVVALESLGDIVRDGESVAFGGGWFANHPMAAVRQLIRAGRRDIHAITVVGSVDMDLMAAAGTLGHLSFSMVTLEAFGLAPNVRGGIESGSLPFTEYTGLGLLIGLEAQGRGMPYLPYRGPFGSDIPGRYPDIYATTTCPFTGEELTAVRALQPDVAIVHALRADAEGNAQWDGTSGPDVEMAKAAKRVIVTCEEVVDRQVIVDNAHMTKLPGYYVDAVIEAPFGAHPTSHVPRYAMDAWELMGYAAAAGDPAAIAEYVAQISGETEEGYRTRVLKGRDSVLSALVDAAEVIEGAQA